MNKKEKRVVSKKPNLYEFLIKISPIFGKIVRNFFPAYIYGILINFRTLAFKYNQLESMVKFSCLNDNSEPIPWYTYPTIEYLNNLDFSDKKIFEYGSGNSSLWWAERCKKIISIESDEKWFNLINKSKDEISNFDYRLKIGEKEYTIQTDIIGSDVIIIDGLFRSECIDFVLSQIDSNNINPNILIFDNSDWYPKTIAKLNQKLKHWVQVDFSGFGPINSYTWTTTLFINPQTDSRIIYKTALTSIAGLTHCCD